MLNLYKRMIVTAFVLLCAASSFAWAADPAEEPQDAAQPAAEHDWTQLDEGEEELLVWDPIEPINRGVFWFNDKFYLYLAKPVARGYRAAVPEPARESVGHFFHNLASPVRIVNALLQLKGQRAFDELLKCVFNSTFGLAGLFDLGVGMPPETDGEDFGQTLGHYGASPGFYLMIPFLGPSNARDAVGMIADALTHPVPSPYYLTMKPLEIVGTQSYEMVNNLSLDKDSYEAIKRDALDPYLFLRNAFMQNRAARIDK